MRKRILAAVLALTIAVAFMPIISFGAVKPQKEKSQTEIAAEIEALSLEIQQSNAELEKLKGSAQFFEKKAEVADKIKELYELIEQYAEDLKVLIKDKTCIDEYQAILEEVLTWEDLQIEIDKLKESLLDEDLSCEAKREAIEAFGDWISAKAQELKDRVKELDCMDCQVIKDAVASLTDAAEKLADYVKDLASRDYIDMGKEAWEKVATAIVDAAKYVYEEAKELTNTIVEKFFEGMRTIIQSTRDWVAETSWITDKARESLNEVLDTAEALLAGAKLIYEDPEILVTLWEVVKDYIADVIDDVAQDLAAYWEKLKADVVEVFGKMGDFVGKITDLIEDVAAYASSYAAGVSFRDLEHMKDEAVAAEKIYEDIAEDALDALYDAETELQKEQDLNAALVIQIEKMKGDDSKYKAQIANASALQKIQPTLDKKGTKGKNGKVTVKWNAVQGAEITSYEVSYKTGKKWTKKKVAANTTSYKIPKKFKKGKKVTVKVRANYTMNYEGIYMTYHSKWSKTKRVKVK